LAAYGLHVVFRRTIITNAGLTPSDGSLDFGEVWENKDFRWSFSIANPTDKDAAIEGFAQSCNCTTVKPSSCTIPAGGAYPIEMAIDLTKGSRLDEESRVREFSVHIVPRIKDGLPVQEGWRIHGKVRQPFRVRPAVLELGELLSGNESKPRSAEIECDPSLKELTVAADGGFASVSLFRSEHTSNVYRLEVRANPSIPGGAVRFAVSIGATSTSGESVRAFLPVIGQVLEDIYVLPDALNFGARSLRETVEETVVLRSRKGRQFTVSGMMLESAELSVTPYKARAQEGQAFLVRQRISKLDHQRNELRFLILSDDGAVSKEIVLPVIYHGIDQNQHASTR